MPTIFLGIGSNLNRERHICSGLDMLYEILGGLKLSSVYESDAVGFSGRPFYNLVAAAETNIGLGQLTELIKAVEDKNGRDRTLPKFSSRTLDIDVLLFGECSGCHDGTELPRPEILEFAHVLCPLAEIAGDRLMPGTNISFASLWQQYDKSRQDIWPVDFEWQGRKISIGR